MLQSYSELEKNFDWINWTEKEIRTYTYLGMQVVQNLVDVPAWMAGYKYALDQGLTDKQSVAYADNLVETTQGNTTVSGLANLQYLPDVFRLFTVLSTNVIAINQRAGNIVLRGNSAKSKMLALTTLGLFTAGMVGTLNSFLAEIDDDEDDEKKQKKGEPYFMDDLSLRLFTESIDIAIPVFGRPITSLASGREAQISPVLDQLSQANDAVRGVQMYRKGIDMTDFEQRSLFNMLGLVHPAFTVTGKLLSLGKPDRGEQKALKRLRRRQIEALKRESR
jgi:hypothetical protein